MFLGGAFHRVPFVTYYLEREKLTPFHILVSIKTCVTFPRLVAFARMLFYTFRDTPNSRSLIHH